VTKECADCTTPYAIDLEYCPHCGSDRVEEDSVPKNTHQGPSIAGWNVPLPGESREAHADRLGLDVKDLPESGAQADMRRQQAGDRPDTSAPDRDVPGQRESIHSGSEGANPTPAATPDDTAGQATTAGDREKADDLRHGNLDAPAEGKTTKQSGANAKGK
jgi:hypothetical protein